MPSKYCPNSPWTDELVAALREYAATSSMTYRQFGAEHGLSVAQVKGKMCWLRLTKQVVHVARAKPAPKKAPEFIWTTEKVNLLDGMFNEGLSTRLMASFLGTTKNSVIGRLHRNDMLRLGPKDKRETEKQRIARLVSTFPDGCLYPNGEPEKGGWDFCGAVLHVHFDKLGEPIRSAYCEAHHALTHIKPLKAEGAEVIALRRSSTARTRWTAA